MRARLNTADLSLALAAVKPAVGPQRPFVLLEMNAEGLRVAADDLDVGISTIVDIAPELADDEGRVMVAHPYLTEFVNKADGAEIQMITEDDRLVIGDGPARMTLATVPNDWFPVRGVAGSDLKAVLDGDAWSRVRGLATFASTKDSAGPLTCVSFGEAGASATDMYRVASFDHPFDFGTLVPAVIIQAIPDGAAEVILTADERVISLEADGTTVTTGTMGGLYPPWRNKVPEHEGTITVGSRALIKAIDRASILSRKDANHGKVCRFIASGEDLAISSEREPDSTDAVSGVIEPLDGTKDKVDYDFGVNIAYLRACIEVLGKPDQITLRMSGPYAPITAVADDSFVLIMPTKLPTIV